MGSDLVAIRGFRIVSGLVGAALVVALAFGVGMAPAAKPAACPSFRVLHNDRIGPAVLPAGTYTLTPSPGAGVPCKSASALFTRFLADYDGVLPRPWTVIPKGTGRVDFAVDGEPGFSAEIGSAGGGSGEGGSTLGALCPGSFAVNASARIGVLSFAKGGYLLYLPPRSQISCRRASALFTRFLAAPAGRLPFPWRLTNQTATFYKPAHPNRSAFRVEPLSGAGAAE